MAEEPRDIQKLTISLFAIIVRFHKPNRMIEFEVTVHGLQLQVYG